MKRHLGFFLTTILASALPLPSPVMAREAAASSAALEEHSSVPFTQASVRLIANGDVTVEWSSAGSDQVQIYALSSANDDKGRLVASGGGSGRLSLTAASIGGSRFFRLAPGNGPALVLSDRLGHIDAVPNLRDIGGYRTMDGRWVRMGRIYRSDKLSRLTPASSEQFAKLDIATVGDLRSAREREKEPDRLPQGVRHQVFDIMGSGAAPENFMKSIMDGKGDEMMRGVNRGLVGSIAAQKEFAGLVGAISASDKPFLYHCTAGKDRTGWATAVLLTILGVPRETIIYDYMISRERLKSSTAANIVGEGENPFSKLPKELTDPLMTVEMNYIEAAFDEVERRYGSFDNYVRDGLKISLAEQDHLRSVMLIGKPWRPSPSH